MSRTRLRIASIAYWNAFSDDGVLRKLRTQVEAWRGLGTDSRLFLLSPASPGSREPPLDADLSLFDSPLGRVSALRALVRKARAYSPDVVYVRYDLFVPPLSARRLSCPLVVELNTLLEEELRGRATRARVYNRASYAATLRSATGMVGVSEEIVAATRASYPRLPSAVIPNGVDPGGIPILPAPSNPSPRLCFMGSPGMRWHGIDKLVALAAARPSWTIDVIGFTAAEIGDVVPPNVVAHGHLTRDAYLDVMARADAAVGTLALHRKGMTEASPLKVPEYLLAGLPTIVGYVDSNFLDVDPWYLLRLPNTEDNVARSVPEIDAWLAAVRGRRAPRAEVEARVGVPAKEAARVEFIRSILDLPR